MSDEEKEALEILKSFEPDDLVECAIYLQALEKITNLIERQQKEIEELKQEKEYLNCIVESDEDNYINKDKVNAKIEEYEKNKKILEERKNGVFYSVEEIDKVDRNIKFYDVMINEMRSLLEKE